jgi:hypothetical protein
MAKAINIVISGNAAPLRQALNETDDLFKKSFGGIQKVALAAAGAIAGAGALAYSAIQDAADLGETLSKAGVLFGKQSKEIEKFAGNAAKSLGLTKQAALDGASTFATFGRSAGLSGVKLAKFSTDFVTLAGDLASFNNTTPEEAIEAIGAALRGEAEPLRRFGVLLDDATLRQKALELGIIDTVKKALTPQEKVLAAQAVIFDQTSTAQGDFARTSESLSNQQKILAAELKNVKTEIGIALLPIMETLVAFVRENLIPIIENLSETFSEEGLSGVLKEAGQDFSDFIENAEGSQAFLINLTGTVLAFAAAFKAFTIISTVTTAVSGLLTTLGTLGASIPGLLGASIGAIASVAGLAVFNVMLLVDSLRNPIFRSQIGEVIVNSLKLVANGFIFVIEVLTDGFNVLIDAANRLNPFSDIPRLIAPEYFKFTFDANEYQGAIGKGDGFSGLQIPAFANGGIVQSATLGLIGEKGPEAVIPLNRLGNMGNTYSITVQAGVGDPREIGRQVVDAIRQYERTAGPVFAAA